MRIVFFILITLAVLMTTSCGRPAPSPFLLEIERGIEDGSESSFDRLNRINADTLSECDLRYRDFLIVKATDKAYLPFTSDSLIRGVLDYFGKDKELLPEIQYYAGRVYAELGDYPEALSHFQNALDRLPENTPDQKLRATILSQTAGLLCDVRLYDQAIPYIRQALGINYTGRTKMSEIYDLQLLGDIYTEKGEYAEAENCFRKALRLSSGEPMEHSARNRMHLAAIKYRRKDIDSALLYIRDTPDQVSPFSRTAAMAYAACIYKKAGILDSAYFYAQRLVNDPDTSNLATGLQILLSSEIRPKLPDDSIFIFIDRYAELIERLYNRNSIDQINLQMSSFNYKFQEREKDKAVTAKANLQKLIFIIVAVAILLGLGLLVFKVKNQRQLIHLHEALEKIKLLNDEIIKVRATQDMFPSSSDDTAKEETVSLQLDASLTGSSKNNENDLKDKLIKELEKFSDHHDKEYEVPSHIIRSKAYSQLQDFLRDKEMICDKDNFKSSVFWNELEKTILREFPKFKENLLILTNGRIKEQEYQTALLIKCGMTPGQMAILFRRSINTIASRRESICVRIFNEKLGAKYTDNIIRSL